MDSDPAGHYYGSSALARMSWEWGRYVEGQSSGGMLGRRGYSLFKQGFENELADSVSKGINQLLKDWAFLTMLMKAILNYSDAAELLQQSGKDSVVQKINACGHEMSEYLEARHCGNKYIFNRPKKFSILLSHCRTMTDALLKEEVIGASALEHISSLVFKAKPVGGKLI